MADLAAQMRRRPYLFALGLAIALIVANVIAQPSFGDPSNVPEELAALAPFALAAMASTPSIVSGGGGLDLSIGPLLTLCNIAFVVWLLPHGLGAPEIAIPILLALGFAVGAINGILVAVLRFQPVIATLCTFFVLGGVDAKIATTPQQARSNWTSHFAGSIAHVPGALILIAVPAVIWFVLRRGSYLRTLYAVGGNDATAYSAGVNVVGTRVIAYALGGVFAAVGAIALTALVQDADSSVATQYTLIALAAVALGGTPLGGGRGGLWGSALGATCIYLLQSLLSSTHVASTWLNVVYGVLLILGVILSARLASSRRTAGVLA